MNVLVLLVSVTGEALSFHHCSYDGAVSVDVKRPCITLHSQ